MALRVPKKAPFFAVITLVDGASTSSIGVRLVAKSAIVTEIAGTVLPADRANTIVAVSALRVA